MDINLLPYLAASKQEVLETFKDVINKNNLLDILTSLDKSIDIIQERKIIYKDPRFKYRAISLGELKFLKLFFLVEVFKRKPEMIKHIDNQLIDLYIETLDNQLDKLEKIQVPKRLQKIITTLEHIIISEDLPTSYEEAIRIVEESKELITRLNEVYFFFNQYITEQGIPLSVILRQRIICFRLDETITLEEFIEIIHIIYLNH